MNLEKVALITGASGGIGRDIALEHAKYGDLVITARSAEKLNNLKDEITDKYKREVYVIVKDLSESEAPAEIYNELKNRKIEVDYLINNAGFGGYGYFWERATEDDLKMINLNIIALTHLTRLFLPDMVSRNKGKILNVASIAGFMPGPMQAVYYATKSFVISFSNAIAEELSDTDITVTALCPGPVDTGFVKAANLEGLDFFKKNVEKSPDVAKKGYEAMMKGKLTEITQLPLKIGVKAFLPFIPQKLILSIVKKLQTKGR